MARNSADASARRDVPVSDLTGMPVYTRDGYRLGRAVGVTVDVDAERATGVLVDADEDRFPNLPTGRKGVRVPYDSVEGVGDVVVTDVPGATFGAAATADAESRGLSEALATDRRRGRAVR